MALTLTDEQRAAIMAAPGPVRIVAGPGSGKTLVLTQRLARFVRDGLFPAHKLLAVTFTVKAATEMRARLRALLGDQARAVRVCTLHSLAYGIVRDNWEAAGAPPAFEIMVSRGRLSTVLEQVLTWCRARDLLPVGLSTPDEARAALARLKHSEPLRLLNSDDTEPDVQLSRLLSTRLAEQLMVTFDDLCVMALRALRNCQHILAIELLAAAQALDFRAPLQPADGPRAAYAFVRARIPHIAGDRNLQQDLRAAHAMIESGALLHAVESELGALD